MIRATQPNDTGAIRVWHLLVATLLAAGTFGGIQAFTGDDSEPSAVEAAATSSTTLPADPQAAPIEVPTTVAAPAPAREVARSSSAQPTATTVKPASAPTTSTTAAPTTTTAVAASGPPYWCTVTLDRNSAHVGETITGTVRTNSDRGRIMFQVWPNRYWFGTGTTFTQAFPVQDDDTGTVRVFVNFSPNSTPDAECRTTYTVVR